MSFAEESAIVWIWGAVISVALMRLRPSLAAVIAPLGAGLFALAAVCIQARYHLWFAWLVPVAAQTSVALVWSVGFQYAVEARRRRKLRRAFSAYLSPHLADRIAESEFDVSLGGHEVEATILFTDLEGFTSMSETMSPAEVSRILTTYFNETTQAILKEEGTIIKYLGDAVMAAWGAPMAEPRPATRAVLAALGMQHVGRKEIAGRILRTRFGINTGMVLAGNLGSEFRFDYTLIGKAANLASRLEGLNKYLGTEILISESVRRELEAQVLVRNVGSFIVVGSTQATGVYEVIGLTADFQPPPPWLDLFARALAQFTKRELDAAGELFRKVIEQRGGQDGPSNFYLKQIAQARSAPESDTPWDGNIHLDSK
jgi:adenylate cyclase